MMATFRNGPYQSRGFEAAARGDPADVIVGVAEDGAVYVKVSGEGLRERAAYAFDDEFTIMHGCLITDSGRVVPCAVYSFVANVGG